MSEPFRSKRFSPSTLSEKVVPALLILLALGLLTVLVVLGLSLLGVFPSA